MSAPATNARPAPVRITPATSVRVRSSSIATPSSRIVVSLSALSLSGRLTVRTAIRSSTDRLRLEYIRNRGLRAWRSGVREPMSPRRLAAENLTSAVSFLPTHASRMATRWLRRIGSKGSGFRYVDERGRPLRDQRTIQRIRALVLPPAWRDVHVAASPRTNIQAWGFDARGRKQYRYHDRAVERRERRKYYRVRQLAKELPRMRRRLRDDANARDLARITVAATVLRLITESFCRVGGERYPRENGTYGVTTLKKSHVSVEHDYVTLEYKGKSNKNQRQVIVGRELARLIRRQLRTPGARLFRYRTSAGA